jgi:flagellin
MTTNAAGFGVGGQAGGTQGVIAGSYFTFSTPTSNYYVWFDVQGFNSDPAPGGYTGIRVALNGNESSSTVRAAALAAIQASGASVTASTTGSPYATGLTITNTQSGVVSAPSTTWMTPSMSVNQDVIGTGSPISSAADTITLASHGLTTGQALTFTSAGTLPGGISSGTTYYAIVVDSNTIKLATSYSNAFSGTALDITSSGVGTLTATPYVTTAATSTTTAVSNLDLSSQAGARTSMDTLETTMQQIQNTLGSIGASQSRIGVAIANLSTLRDVTSAAASRIMDTNIAEDSANLVREQILQKAASAVLAHANQEPALILKLLN